MTLLVFGKTGQVARELRRAAPGATYLGREDVDLTDARACAAAVAASGARTVINAAAYTGVDRAEDDADTAFAVNGVAPAAMAQACAAKDIPLVHISTDYVFDGSGARPWRPDDPTGPLGVYGASKLAGEDGIRAAGGCHAILRTSWVVSAHGANFVKTMARLGKSRDALTVVSDQIGGPTPASGIASACLAITEALARDPSKAGTYHYAGAPDVSWADFAREIFARTGQTVTVSDIPSAQYPTPAKRPGNSRLDCSSLMAAFGIARPDWRAGLDAILAEIDLGRL